MKAFLRLLLVIGILLIITSSLEPESIESKIINAFENEDTMALFKVFHFLFKRKYDINSEEAIKRYKIFNDNLAYINMENRKGHSYTLGITKMMDLTDEEFLKLYAHSNPEELAKQFDKFSKIGEESEKEKNFFNTPDEDDDDVQVDINNKTGKMTEEQIKNFFDSPDEDDEVKKQDDKKTSKMTKEQIKNFFDSPDEDEGIQVEKNEIMGETKKVSFKNTIDFEEEDRDELKLRMRKLQTPSPRMNLDWRSILTPVRDQGHCNSCWAFASAGASEAAYSLKNPTLPNFWFSPQHLVDCDKEKSKGCIGGFTLTALSSFGVKTGFVEDSLYPYTSGTTGVDGTCQTVSKTYKLSKVSSCNPCSIDDYYNKLSRGPVVISSYIVSDWKYYKTGIFTYKSCAYESANHAMIAVGWGSLTDANGVTEYIIVRNSWGSSWGENGYIRFKYDQQMNNSCFITRNAYLPLF